MKTYLVFLFIIILCVLFVIFFVPETKNRTIDDIARDLAFGSGTGPSFTSQSLLLHEGVRKEVDGKTMV
jgi:hypothetical protein